MFSQPNAYIDNNDNVMVIHSLSVSKTQRAVQNQNQVVGAGDFQGRKFGQIFEHYYLRNKVLSAILHLFT
jgi:hypothetical protein